jgi:dextranase
VETGTSLSANRVAVVTRERADSETFSLVNLMGIEDGHWNGTATKTPTPLSDLAVQIQTDRSVSRVWLASPDGDSSAMQAVDFTAGDGVIQFNVPSLAYWTMIVVAYR